EQPGAWGNGSSADLAVLTGWPVVLVLDVSGQSQTAAAVARGFCGFRAGVDIAGVILNRIGSERHVKLVRSAFDLPVLGAIPRRSEIALPERHLGLVQAEETTALAVKLDALADLVEAHVDIDRLRAVARAGHIANDTAPVLRPPGQRIALARDAAFSFVYPHLMTAWRMFGAEILPFSPLADAPPDPSADVVWLPGGYPELHAERLSANRRFAAGMRAFARSKPVHGECGGYMVLGESLEDADGRHHAMLGLLGLRTSFAKRKLHLGYRRVRLLNDCPIGAKGETVCGHEFHYATVLHNPDAPFADIADAEDRKVAESGGRRGLVTGSFFHMVDANDPIPEPGGGNDQRRLPPNEG
ncbi:MAG: cobyrinate a,c-diamide synthase, partial [Hyphomicrobiaceae bacterium]